MSDRLWGQVRRWNDDGGGLLSAIYSNILHKDYLIPWCLLEQNRKVSFTANIYKASVPVSIFKSLFVQYIAHPFYGDIIDVFFYLHFVITSSSIQQPVKMQSLLLNLWVKCIQERGAQLT